MNIEGTEILKVLIIAVLAFYVAWLVFYMWYRSIIAPERKARRQAYEYTKKMYEFTHRARMPSMRDLFLDDYDSYYQHHKTGILRRSALLDFLVRTRGLVFFVIASLILLIIVFLYNLSK